LSDNGLFLFLQSSKPKSFTPRNRDNETISEEATTPSIIPVGTALNCETFYETQELRVSWWSSHHLWRST